jgi:hypothetical protein
MDPAEGWGERAVTISIFLHPACKNARMEVQQGGQGMDDRDARRLEGNVNWQNDAINLLKSDIIIKNCSSLAV